MVVVRFEKKCRNNSFNWGVFTARIQRTDQAAAIREWMMADGCV